MGHPTDQNTRLLRKEGRGKHHVLPRKRIHTEHFYTSQPQAAV